MPIYEYKCTACDSTFEELVRSEAATSRVKCPQCGSPKVGRQPSVFAAHGAPARPERQPSCQQSCPNSGTCPMANQ